MWVKLCDYASKWKMLSRSKLKTQKNGNLWVCSSLLEGPSEQQVLVLLSPVCILPWAACFSLPCFHEALDAMAFQAAWSHPEWAPLDCENDLDAF